MTQVAVGIVASECDRPEQFLPSLIEPVTIFTEDKKGFGLFDENAIIRYYSVEYIVNLILIMRENVFKEILSFFDILQQVEIDDSVIKRYQRKSQVCSIESE